MSRTLGYGKLGLAAGLQPPKREAERIVKGMDEAGCSQAAIARFFDCSPKTVARILNVQLFPYRGEKDFMTQVLERLEIHDRALLRIEQTLAAIAETLFTSRVPASVFGDTVEALLSQAELERAA